MIFVLAIFTLGHVSHAAQFITDVTDHAHHECSIDGESVIAWRDRFPGGCKSYIHSSKCETVERDPSITECESMAESQGAVNHRFSRGRCTLFFQYPVNGWDECGQSLKQKDVDGYKYSYPDTCEIYYHYKVHECTDSLQGVVNSDESVEEDSAGYVDDMVYSRVQDNYTSHEEHADSVIKMNIPIGELLCGSCSRILS